jgi:hypothetical protein
MSEPETDAEMTATTETLRDRDFRTLECDIPAELTIRQYRESRDERDGRLSRLPRLLRRRARRRAAGA